MRRIRNGGNFYKGVILTAAAALALTACGPRENEATAGDQPVYVTDHDSICAARVSNLNNNEGGFPAVEEFVGQLVDAGAGNGQEPSTDLMH
jgi:hypothetical protein